MPLQSRVSPLGDLFVSPFRGTLMGNRGGRLHTADRQLSTRRWVSARWICCELAFKGRRREVWSVGYTELFFLDEITALAAGHRPCFECRREDAVRFATCWPLALSNTRRAAEMDRVLHAERLDARGKRVHRAYAADLPDGATITQQGEIYAVRGDILLRWSASGYDASRPRSRSGQADVLTPPSILAVLRAAYQPRWHPSAAALAAPPL